jgi:hypothetical protein
MNYKLNNANTAAVSTEVFWIPIDKNTPRGVKLLMINEKAGVAILGKYWGSADQFETHWHPLPQFIKISAPVQP